MRFFADGPDIPDTLIELRDAGEVVFFCGAGVSAPAGLPSFGGLADDIMRRLDAEDSKLARQRDDSLDRVFTAMIKEFGGAAVDREIGRSLRTPRNAELRHHRDAIDLSRGADGHAKIVTTNFDRLFERADRSLRIYVPPVLPDLTQQQPIQGIVHLHGRLNVARNARAGYVISSADFGRAYLAEGWAARFVRDLSERYTIVLLGYTADDPPMRYLLEGLHAREDAARRSLIYAFAEAGNPAADEAWLDKGVTTIPYIRRDEQHGGLWDTIAAWAEASRDPDAWRRQLASMAQQEPTELEAFQRGQVAHLVRSTAGALAFAAADPPPPATWLCTFDAGSRYAKPARLSFDNPTPVDPLEAYGLDDDPPRPVQTPGQFVPAPGDDLLRWRRGDDDRSERQRLAGHHPDWSTQLSSRLFQLARWFGKVMDEPAAIWWAAGNALPHPGLMREIRRGLDRADMPVQARTFWNSYVEASRAHAEDTQDLRRYDLADRVRLEGWTKGVLRALERLFEPTFEVERALSYSPVPPTGGWDVLSLRDVAQIKVAISGWPDDGLAPPPEHLDTVVTIVRRSLERMAELLAESTYLYWRTPTLHPTGRPGDHEHFGRKKSHFIKFRQLFDALAAHDPAAARAEVARWDVSDTFFFAKLFTYATTLPGIVPPAEAAGGILKMPAEVFWESGMARDMLFALKAGWPVFSKVTRRQIERKIVAGPPPYEGEGRAAHRRRRGSAAATWLRWLQAQGAQLSPAAEARLPALMKADARWSEAWIESADDSLGPFGGQIERVTASGGLEDEPIGALLTRAVDMTRDDFRELKDYRPFDGVVAAAPFRALSALRLAGRSGDYPARFWRSLLANWPAGARPRLNLLLAHTLSRLPQPTFFELRHVTADWVRGTLKALIAHDARSGFAAFDAIAARYADGPTDVLASAVGFSTIGGVPQEKSEVSTMKAINSPGGKLTEALLMLLGSRKRRSRMPRRIGDRLELLTRLPGDGAGHAAAVIARQFSWLHWWFPDWTEALVPRFALDDPLSEGLWHGLTAERRFVSDEIGAKLKPMLIGILIGNAPWEMDKEARKQLVCEMTNLTFARKGPPVIRFAEARRVLMVLDDEERSQALALLERSKPEKMWTSFIKPFLLRAWPHHLRYQSDASSRHLAAIAEKSGPLFPEVVATILPFLRPVSRLDTISYRLRQNDSDGKDTAALYPVDTLRLLDALIGDDPQIVPWNLSQILDRVADVDPALRQSDPWRRLKALTA